MAQLRQDLLRTTYQQQQMRAIEDISLTLTDINRVNSKGFLDIYKWNTGFNSYLRQLFSSLENTIRTAHNLPEQGVDATPSAPSAPQSTTQSQNTTAEEVKQSVEETSLAIIEQAETEDLGDDRVEEARYTGISRMLRDYFKSQDEKYDDPNYAQNRDYSNRLASLIENISSTIGDILEKIGLGFRDNVATAKDILELQNSIIQNTGYSKSTAEEFRNITADTVDSLNDEYGGLFNYKESLDLIATLIRETGVQDTDFYDSYTELLLKTSKGMNINLGSLVEFADLYYKRYNFSSKNMEELLTGIREATTGTNYSAEEAQQLIQSNSNNLTDMVATVANGDVDKFNELYTLASEGLVQGRAEFGEIGLGTEYETLVQDLFKAIYEPTSDSASRVRRAGVLPGLEERIASGDITGAVREYMDWYADQTTIGHLNQSSLYGDSLGIDYELANTLYKVQTYGDINQTLDSDEEAAEDPLEGLYIGIEDKLTNINSTVAEGFADYMEGGMIWNDLSLISDIYDLLKRSLGFSFASSLANLLLGNSTGGLFGRISSLFFGSGSITSGGLSGTLLSGLGKGGAIALAIAATAVIAKKISTQMKKYYTDDEEDVQEILEEGLSMEEGAVTRVDYENPDESGDLSISTIETDAAGSDYIGNKSLDDFLNTWKANYEDRTGLLYVGDDEWTSSDIGTRAGAALKTVSNLGRTLAGPGWFKENGKLYERIPIISGLANSISGLLGMGDEVENKKLASALYNLDIYGSTEGPTAMKALINLINDNGNIQTLTTLWTGTYEDDIKSALASGLVPTNITENGIADLISIDDTEYAGYFEQYLSGEIPFYKVGTPYVPEDQLAVIHEGEAIIPKEYNPFNSDLDDAVSESRTSAWTVQETPTTTKSTAVSKSSESLEILIGKTSEILEFLTSWKSDNEFREDMKESRSAVKQVGSAASILN